MTHSLSYYYRRCKSCKTMHDIAWLYQGKCVHCHNKPNHLPLWIWVALFVGIAFIARCDDGYKSATFAQYVPNVTGELDYDSFVAKDQKYLGGLK